VFRLFTGPLTVVGAAGHPEGMTLLEHPVEFFGVDAVQDPYPLYDRLRAEGPVHRVGDSGFYVVCSWEAINDAVNRPHDFSSNLTATMMYTAQGNVVPFELDGLGGPAQILATADDPAHALHRKMLVPQLAAKRIREMETFIADTFDQLWADGQRGGRIEWMAALANKLPMIVVARLIGVPGEDVDRLVRWACASTQLLDGLVDDQKVAGSGIAAMEMAGYLQGHLDRATADPKDNLLGALATACGAGEFEQITAQMMMIILLSAGGESTGSLLGNAMEILATQPHIQQQIRENPDLLDTFIEEALRYEPPFRGHYRHVVADTTLAGTDLPAGARLLLLWGAANRDPAHFDEPSEFRLDRPTGKGHITFGKGLHFCVGAALARLEAQIVLRSVLDRTSRVEAVGIGPWLPSVLVRRREHLWLRIGRESVVKAGLS
jgi:cytochrome P450